MYVLDASAFINLSELFEGEFLTTPEVVKELKDPKSKALLEAKDVKVVDPKKEFIDVVKEKAGETGDILSEADASVLALALEKRAILVTDDYNIQNLCDELGIPFKRASERGIKKKFIRRKCCPNCGKFFEGEKCPLCGAKLVPKVVRVEDLRGPGRA